MRPLGPIGFRLAHELEGILTGIRADGAIGQQEFARVERWLSENEQHALVYPFSEIAVHLRQALRDGVITLDECDDLLFVVQKLTNANPYFDGLRTGTQVLMGLLAGVSADGMLSDAEVKALSQWVEDWSHLQGVWPFDECNSIVTKMLATGKVNEYRDYLFDLVRQFPVAGQLDEETGELPPLLIKGICAVDPSITFLNSQFVFTGESSRADRSALEDLVIQRGGTPWPRVTADTSYLIVCDYGSPFWAFACYGRKVEQAYNLRKKGHGVLIVHELDFWDALADTAAGK